MKAFGMGPSTEELRQFLDGELDDESAEAIRFELAKRPDLKEQLRLLERQRELEDDAVLAEISGTILKNAADALLKELASGWRKVAEVLSSGATVESPRNPGECFWMKLLGLRPSGAALSSEERVPRVGTEAAVLFVEEEGGLEMVLGFPHQDFVGQEIAIRIGQVRLKGACRAHGSGRSRVVFPWGKAEEIELQGLTASAELEIVIESE